MPTVGKKTSIGAFNLGLRYQHSQRDYQGTLSIPTLGNINTELGKDFYLHSYLEFGDREGAGLK